MAGPVVRIDEIQKIVDGTLCLQPSPIPGIQITTILPTFIYCNVWSASDRRAFWKGFLVRTEEMGDKLLETVVWLGDAFGVGDQEGDFAKAWEQFGDGLQELAGLVYKLLVVAGIPTINLLHPKRQEYQKELRDLGIVLTQECIKGYRTSYRAGGIPQCTGRLLADLLAVIVEIVATKGTGKAVKAIDINKLASKLPNKMKQIPDSLKRGFGKLHATALFRRARLVKLHSKGRPVALYSYGRKHELIPKQYATLNRMLDETREGRLLVKQLEKLPWNKSKYYWWELSDRAAKMGAKSGKPVHVFISKEFRDRMFPDATKLKNWWKHHKEELVDIYKKQLKTSNVSDSEYVNQVTAYRRKLDNWTDNEIEAQHYAIKSKSKHLPGNYEDEVFQKIESLNLKDAWLHVVDDAGVQVDNFWHKL